MPLVEVRVPVEKKVSSESDPRVLALPPRRGGVSQISGPSREPSPTPSPCARVRLVADDENSSSRSVRDVVRLNELLRLGAITRGSPGYK